MGKKTTKTGKKLESAKKKTKLKKKITKKKNKKAQSTTKKRKKKRKTRKNGKKSRVAIIVALIGLVGTISAAIIGILGGGRLWPLKKINKYFLKLSSPIVFPDAKLPDGRCFKPPVLGVIAECSNPLEEDAIFARLGKSQQHGDTLPLVQRENLEINSELGGSRLIATMASESFIRKQYQTTPHGRYQAEFEVFDPCGPKGKSSRIEFNYIYKEDFAEPHKVLTCSASDYDKITGIDGGLEIRNWSKQGRYVSAELKQEFDFKTDFCITGFFTVEFENPRDPSGFDIALCDRWGEQLSVVFADGGLNAFSIKMRGEKFKGSGVMVRSNATTIERTTDDNKVYNYFKIRIWQDRGESRCSLYVQSKGSEFRGVPPVHERIIDTSVFGEKCTRIMLKLWKAGILKLYNLEVAETPKKVG